MLSYYKNKLYEVGCDEAGRGSLAGPVVAAAVILNPKIKILGLRDSKKLSPSQREFLRKEIEEKAFAYKVAFVDQFEIDKINILQASLLAMYKAVLQLESKIAHVIVDGNKLIPNLGFSQTAIVKGDDKYESIAAASILAKTYRDEFMSKIHLEFPDYHWNQNKGYGSLRHRISIKEFGLSIYHRKSFKLKENIATLFSLLLIINLL
ncbi:MAG: ribonuclease HII [Saprospiraceae bacterium]